MITDEQLDLWANRLLAKATVSQEHYMYFRFLENLHRRGAIDKDSVILLSGERGEGKSNLAVVSGMLLRLYNFKFDFSHISYGNEGLDDIVEKITSTRKGVFVFDEGIDVANSRSFMSKVNNIITTNLTKSRKKNHIYFWNIPDISDLDSRIKNRIANFWIHVIKRTNNQNRDSDYSTSALLRKDRNPFISDKWGFDDAIKRFKNKPIHSAEQLERMFFRTRGFVGLLRTPRMPKVIEDYYRGESESALKEGGKEGAFILQKNKNQVNIPKGI